LFRTICIAVCSLALAGAAEASFLVGNGPPDQSGASDLNAFLEADSFVLGSAVGISQIQFWTDQVDSTDYAGSTFWAIYSDSSGIPGSALLSGTPVLTGTDDGAGAFGLEQFDYVIPVNFSLSAGTYWLVLHNGPTNVIPATNFYWAWESGVSGNSQSDDLSLPTNWAANDAALAFQITAAVPEPATMWLMGGGLLAAWLARRKLSAKSSIGGQP
jgi:PEP-CTERM motif